MRRRQQQMGMNASGANALESLWKVDVGWHGLPPRRETVYSFPMESDFIGPCRRMRSPLY